MNDLEKAREKARRRRAVDSIDWNALENGETLTFHEETGRYSASEEYAKKKNDSINKYLENRSKL